MGEQYNFHVQANHQAGLIIELLLIIFYSEGDNPSSNTSIPRRI
jgi:hypothetical protein